MTAQIGDFNFDINEVFLVHKCIFATRHGTSDYKNGRKMYGLVYCINGRGKYEFDGGNFTLEQGRMVFLPSSFAYVVCCDGNEPFEHMTVNFNLGNIKSFETTLFSEIVNGLRRCLSSKDNSTVFRELLDRLLSVWQVKQYGYEVMAKSILYEILFIYFSTAGRSLRDKSGYNKILPAKNMLDENYTENISITELSKACGLSETHFRRMFTKLFGFSPTDYRTNKRILKAKDLLLSGEYSVNETALAVGFEDSNYFSRIFKKHTGLPPSDYRSNN